MDLRELSGDDRLGFDGALLSNMFGDIADDDVVSTLDAAWRAGTRYFDTAPFHRAGFSETRVGQFLAHRDRDDYLLSTKVGRPMRNDANACPDDMTGGYARRTFLPANGIVYDYSEEGTLKSIDDSRQRLGVDRIDFVWVHDVAQDFHGDAWLGQFETARTGAFRALTKLREQHVISGWGIGVNRTEPIELLLGLSEVNPDGSLLAGRYTLLDHRHALQRVMPTAQAHGVDMVLGDPYNSGILSDETPFAYRNNSPAIAARVESINAVAKRHRVPIKAAALQFCLAHPATAAVIPVSHGPVQIAEDHRAMAVEIPAEFWHELRARDLVSPDAPLPSD
jgi:D-threo-aldose 1-dehydrogenase